MMMQRTLPEHRDERVGVGDRHRVRKEPHRDEPEAVPGQADREGGGEEGECDHEGCRHAITVSARSAAYKRARHQYYYTRSTYENQSKRPLPLRQR